jgi:hypothetical protein
MTNSDTTYGLHNKLTKILYQKTTNTDGSTATIVAQSFSGNLTTAKDFFLTAEAQALNDAKATQLSYAITGDGNGLKFTIAFGIPENPDTTPWAKAWEDGKAALIADPGWYGGWVPSARFVDDDNDNEDEKQRDYKKVESASSEDHLF